MNKECKYVIPKVTDIPTVIEASNYKIDKLHNAQQFFSGLVNKTFPMADGVRSYKAYLPDGCRNDEIPFFIAVPDGVDSVEFVAAQGWFALAEETKIILGILEPQNGKWKAPEEEVDYFVMVCTGAGTYNMRNSVNFDVFNNRYVGYGAGADCMNAFAMKHPLDVSAFVSVDPLGRISPQYLKDTADTPFLTTRSAHGTPDIPLDITLGKAPVPVWFMLDKPEDMNAGIIDYWKCANDVLPEPELLKCGREWLQDPNSPNPITNDQKVGNVRLTTHPDGDLTRRIYNYAMRFARSGHGSPYSNCLNASIDPKRFKYESKIIDGYEREWCVYLPSYYKPEMKLPLVIYYHGTHQTCWSASRQGNWWKVAEARGFISVCISATLEGVRFTRKIPSNSWNCDNYGNANEIVFLHEFMEHMEKNYNIDRSRVYCNGQSNGGRMTVYSALCMPDIFTATASLGASGLQIEDPNFRPPTETREDLDVAVMSVFGDFDLQNHDLDDPNSDSAKRCKYWCDRYGLNFPDYYSRDLGRFHIDVWHNKNMIPMMAQMVTQKRAHNHRVEEQFIIWDEWFSKFARDKDGTLLYMGKRIEK